MPSHTAPTPPSTAIWTATASFAHSASSAQHPRATTLGDVRCRRSASRTRSTPPPRAIVRHAASLCARLAMAPQPADCTDASSRSTAIACATTATAPAAASCTRLASDSYAMFITARQPNCCTAASEVKPRIASSTAAMPPSTAMASRWRGPSYARSFSAEQPRHCTPARRGCICMAWMTARTPDCFAVSMMARDDRVALPTGKDAALCDITPAEDSPLRGPPAAVTERFIIPACTASTSMPRCSSGPDPRRDRSDTPLRCRGCSAEPGRRTTGNAPSLPPAPPSLWPLPSAPPAAPPLPAGGGLLTPSEPALSSGESTSTISASSRTYVVLYAILAGGGV
mmetsp:Transcript_5752/g.20646  ORF Transcript_5752/g.20646 Transcript_5752/m.20646 type:complete len:341 (-) Transcript_5752:1592-2614(-)